MLEVTVKTLDSQNHSFTVPDESTVKEFKAQIASVLNIPADKQRLIFCGKVLKDDKKLNEYDVNGKVLHVVQSLPPQANSASSASTSTSTNFTAGNAHASRDAAGFLLGAFTIPQDLVDPTQVQNIVQDVVAGMGEIGRNATVMSRASEDGSVDVHINLGQNPIRVPFHSEAQLRMNRVQAMLMRANHLLDSIEESGRPSTAGGSANQSASTENKNGESSSVPADPQTSSSSAVDAPSTSEASNYSEESLLNENGESDLVFPEGVSPPSEESIGASNIGSREDFTLGELPLAAQAAVATALRNAALEAFSDVRMEVMDGIAVPQDLQEFLQSRELQPTSTSSEPMDVTPSDSPVVDFIPTVDIMPDPTIIDMDAPPSDAESPAADQAPAGGESSTAAHSESNSHHPDCPLSSTPGQTNNSTTGPQAANLVQGQPPSVQTLANLLDEVIQVNTRLQPALERCRDLIRNDTVLQPREIIRALRFYNRMSQLMHFLSHAFHNLSDLHVNFGQPPPRSPRVRIIATTRASVVQGIPVQAQISFSTTTGPATNRPSSATTTSTTTTSNAARDSTASSTNENRPASAPVTTQPSVTTNTTTIPIPGVNQGPRPFTEVRPGGGVSSSRAFLDITPTSATITPVSRIQPDLFYNLMGPLQQMLSQRRVPTTTTATTTASTEQRPTRNTSASTPNTSTNTNTTSNPSGTSTRNRATAFGPVNVPLRNLIPVPLTSMGSVYTFDSGLPCHSVWALEPSRRRHNAGGSRTNSATPSQPVSVNPNAPGTQQQQQQLNQVIGNIVMSLFNEAQDAAQPTTSASFPWSFGNDSPNTSTDGSDPVVIVRSTPTLASVLRVFNELNLSNTTLVDLLPWLSIPREDNIGRLVLLLAKKLRLKDIVQLSYNVTTPCIQAICDVLAEFFRSSSDREHLVRTILAEIDKDLDTFAGCFEPRVGHNLGSVLRNLCKSELNYLKSVFTHTHENESSRRVRDTQVCWTRFFGVLLSTLKNETTNGVATLKKMIHLLIDPYIAPNVGGSHQAFIQAWVTDSINKLFIPKRSASMPRTSANREAFIASLSQARADSDSSLSQGNSSSSRPNFRSNFAEALGGIRIRDSPLIATFAARRPQQNATRYQNNTQPNDTDPLADFVQGSEAWHDAVPQDWVPIIHTDVKRQRSQTGQPPFSNGYLSGMPSKRRKIIANGNASLFETSQSALSDMLLQAISSANVKPTTSMDELKKDISKDDELLTSFNDHMKHTIQERLQYDMDYCGDRFPNSEKYFK